MDDIKKEKHPYRPVSENSNSTVDEALDRVGLPQPTSDGYGDNWAPGSGDDVLDTPGSSPWDFIKDRVSDAFVNSRVLEASHLRPDEAILV